MPSRQEGNGDAIDMVYCKACKCKLRPHVQDLKVHVTRHKHIQNMKSMKLASVTRPIDSHFKPGPSKPTSTQLKIAELRLAAHVAVHSSLCSADHLAPLLASTFPESNVAVGVTLGRTKCTALVSKVLGHTFREMLLEDIGEQPYSLIIDESTDISCEKEMGVVVRFFSMKADDFQTRFLGLIPITDASANGMFVELKSFLELCHLDLTKCVGIGTDGASVMCGRHHSLYSLLKEENPKLILAKCTCHSLHLACSEATAALPANIEFLVRECYNWFSCSPKRREQYRLIYSAINETNPIRLVSIANTRWLSVAAAVNRIIDQWTELRLHFQIAQNTERCYTARLLHEMFQDEKNYLYMLFIQPIISEFDRVNRLFQSENPDPVKLFEDLDMHVRSMLFRVVLKEHACPTAEWEKHLLHVRACNYGTVFSDAFHKSSLSDGEKDQMLDRCRVYLVACIKSLLKRLPDNLELLQNFKLLRPRCIRDTPFRTFHRVISIVAAPSSTSTLESEYGTLQSMLPSLAMSDNVSEFWRAVAKFTNSAGEPLFPKLSAVAFALLCLPVSNAAVERVFSLVTVTKTDHRNKLSVRTLEMILHVRCGLKEYGCCNNFEPSPRFLEKFNSAVMYE